MNKKITLSYLILLGLLVVACQSNSKDQVSPTKLAALNETSVEKDKIPQASFLKGVDVSHYQGKIDWTKLKSDQCYFAYAQATDGITFFDPMFSVNWTAMKANGIYRGAYHFFEPEDDPISQADSFMKAVGSVSQNDLPPMLDLEKMMKGISVEAYQARVHKWLTYMEEKFNKKPIIYTNPSFANKYLNDSSFEPYTLWIAEYDVDAPEVPKAWSSKGWRIWQYNSKGKVNGISGNVDMDKFKGDVDMFKKLMSL